MFEKIRKSFNKVFAVGEEQKLSLPAGAPGGKTGITLQGRSFIEIDGCLGLTEYADERIVMNVKEGAVEVCGKGLALRIYHGAHVAVCGKIDGLRFCGEAKK